MADCGGSFACDKCPRTFKLEEFYDKHKKVHELKKQHVCEICGFVYGAAKGLEGHVKTHTEDEIARARRGGGRQQNNFTSSPTPPYNLDFHFLNSRGVLAQAPILMNLQAPVLLPAGRREKSLSLEMAMTSGEEDRNASAGTGSYKIYDSVPDLTDPHLSSPNSNGFFTCNLCRREFSGLNSLKKHVPIHTRRVQHRCDVCGFVFGKREYLMDHARKHTGEISPVCEVCGQTFNKSLKLKEHFKLHRNLLADGNPHAVLPYRCHVCREVFQQPEVLGTHLSTAHASTETVYRCDVCDATFGDVRGKNHHMYNEHQTDAFHTKCVWCPVCSQGFTRHYNLKVHMYKTHGKEYVENNFTAEEFAALTNVSKTSPNVNKSSKKTTNGHYFDQKRGTQVLACSLCSEKFMRKSDLVIHLENTHHLPVSANGILDPKEGQRNRTYDEEEEEDEDEPPVITIKPVMNGKKGNSNNNKRKRRPGPASRTNPPIENRAFHGNIPSYLDDILFDVGKNGFECRDCGKVLQHKQSFVSHMRVIHGNYYGGNKWRGHSSVVDMILEESTKLSPKKRGSSKSGVDANATMCSVCEQVFPNQSSLRNHIVNVHIQGQNFTCDLCGKAFLCQENLDAHTKSKHPNLNKRLQSLRDALGLSPADAGQPESKRPRLIIDDERTVNSKPSPTGISESKSPSSSLPSTSVLSISAVNSSSSSLSSSPIVVDFPCTSKDYTNNNNEGEVPRPIDLSNVVVVEPISVELLLSQQSPVCPLSPSSLPVLSSRKKNSVCKVCGVVLSPKTNVNVHMRTHSGARPYQCVLCLNKFRQKAHLMKHFRCSHNQKRPPFVCLFCPDECVSSNDLYRHITDRHSRETEEMTRLNAGMMKMEEDEIRIDGEPSTPQPIYGDEEEDDEDDNDDEEEEVSPPHVAPPPSRQQEIRKSQQQQVQDEEEDVRYEPITEAFVFEEQVIHPCYIVLPFVSDTDVETLCKRSISVYYGNVDHMDSADADDDDDDEDEEGQLTIDESRAEEAAAAATGTTTTSSTEDEEESPMLESLLHKPAKELGLSGGELLQPDNGNDCYNADDIKEVGPPQSGFYPTNLVGDFSLPFSLSSIWKKKMDVLPPETIHQLEMIQKMEEIKQMNAPAVVSHKTTRPKPKPKSKQGKGKTSTRSPVTTTTTTNNNKSSEHNVNSTTQVSDYESQIQNDFWPLDCIKCNTLLGNLDNFNLHMNDHWSEDKCCPVCGLLINSKRFNFKQHLKIHTGEKPFTCGICSRSFRQKAHMVKHVTTHRTMPGENGQAVSVK